MYIIPVALRGRKEGSNLFQSTNASDPPLSAKDGIREIKRLLDSNSVKVSPAIEEGYATIGSYPLKNETQPRNYHAFYGPEKPLRALALDAKTGKTISEEFLADIFHINIFWINYVRLLS